MIHTELMIMNHCWKSLTAARFVKNLLFFFFNSLCLISTFGLLGLAIATREKEVQKMKLLSEKH